MHIYDVLKKLKNQFVCILKKECNKFNKRNMLRTFFLISKQLEILRTWTIKFLQLVLILLVMSVLTSTHYNIISATLTIIYIGLVAYIIIDNFIALKQQYEELRLSCSIKPESQPATPSSE